MSFKFRMERSLLRTFHGIWPFCVCRWIRVCSPRTATERQWQCRTTRNRLHMCIALHCIDWPYEPIANQFLTCNEMRRHWLISMGGRDICTHREKERERNREKAFFFCRSFLSWKVLFPLPYDCWVTVIWKPTLAKALNHLMVGLESWLIPSELTLQQQSTINTKWKRLNKKILVIDNIFCQLVCIFPFVAAEPEWS